MAPHVVRDLALQRGSLLRRRGVYDARVAGLVERRQVSAAWDVVHSGAMHRTRRALLTIALLLVTTRAAAFCDCLPIREPFEALMRADAVFEARLLARLPHTERGDEVWAIETLRAWKGTSTRDDKPIHNDGSCLASLEPGRTYLFYAHQDRSGTNVVNRCSRLVAADDIAADLSEIGPPRETRDPSQPTPLPSAPRPSTSAQPPPPSTSCASSCAISRSTKAPGALAATLLLVVALCRKRRRRGQTAADGSHLAALVGLAGLLSSAALPGCNRLPEGACLDRSDCREGLACVENRCRDFASYCRDDARCRREGLCTPGVETCIAASDEDCRGSTECADAAKCTARDGNCVVATTADCAQSDLCRLAARCTIARGICAPTSDADCRVSDLCRLQGACHLDGNGECSAANADDCRRSRACRRDGGCSVLRGFCAATSDEDCANSERCKQYGACFAREGRCDRGCAKGLGCRVSGACTESDGQCIATSEDDCHNSRICRKMGECTLVASRTRDRKLCAIDSDADCRRSERCTDDGACTLVGGHCLAKFEEDCQASKGCKASGRCTILELTGGAICHVGTDADCERSSLCSVEGRCMESKSRCVARGAGACKQSLACRESGLCSFLGDEEGGTCFAATDADCLASGDCKRFGHCAQERGVCVRR